MAMDNFFYWIVLIFFLVHVLYLTNLKNENKCLYGCLSSFFILHSPGGHCNWPSLMTFFSISCITNLQAPILIFEVFKFFFIDIIDLCPPGSCCNWYRSINLHCVTDLQGFIQFFFSNLRFSRFLEFFMFYWHFWAWWRHFLFIL